MSQRNEFKISSIDKKNSTCIEVDAFKPKVEGLTGSQTGW